MTPADLEAVRKRHEARERANRIRGIAPCLEPKIHEDRAALLAHIDTPPDQVESVRDERSAEDIGSWIEENLHQYTGVVRSNAHDLYVEFATALLQRFPGMGSGVK